MQRYKCTITKKGRIGEVSSKYGYDRYGKQFEADIKAHIEKGEKLYKDFVEWMKTQDVDPRKFRYLFIRYYEEFIQETAETV